MKENNAKQLLKFKVLLKEILNNNRFYKNKFNKVNITSSRDIKSWKDFQNIPFTTKEELYNDRISFPPYGTNLSKKTSDYIYITFTSGTSTGKRINTLYTLRDYQYAVKKEKIWLQLMNITSSDKVMFLLPYALYKFLADATIDLGALLIPGDSKSTTDLIHNMILKNPTILETSPTNVVNIMEIAKKENLDLHKIGLKKVILTGEILSKEIRKTVEQNFGCDCYDALGSTELSIYSFDCIHKKGPHLIEDDTIFEVVDPKTGNHSLKGELICTSLWRRDYPFIRYKTGDYVNISNKKCSCGWKGKTLKGGILKRIDGSVQINETSFFPFELENLIKTELRKKNNFIILLKKINKLDKIFIYIESPLNYIFDYQKNIKTKIFNLTGIYPTINIVLPNSIEKFEWKSKYFYDCRINNTENVLLLNNKINYFYNKLYKLLCLKKYLTI